MTRCDAWKKRPAVVRYHNFKDQLRGLGIVDLPEMFSVIFCLPMPKSWSKKKKREMAFTPHRGKPDKDNLIKALQDAILGEDKGIWFTIECKLWSPVGMIIIDPIN